MDFVCFAVEGEEGGDKPEGWRREGLCWTTDTEPSVHLAGYHEAVGVDTELGQTATNRLLKHWISQTN